MGQIKFRFCSGTGRTRIWGATATSSLAGARLYLRDGAYAEFDYVTRIGLASAACEAHSGHSCAHLLPQWASAMIGVISLPLVIAGYFVDSKSLRPALLAMGVLCFVIASYLVWKKERGARIEAEKKLNDRAILVIDGPAAQQIHNSTVFVWRVKLLNDGQASAKNPYINLMNIDPQPRDPSWPADYPYPIKQTLSTFDAPNHPINSGDSRDFDVISIWKSHIGGFDASIDTKSQGGNYTHLDAEEMWTLKYQATAENADPVLFALEVVVVNGSVDVHRGS